MIKRLKYRFSRFKENNSDRPKDISSHRTHLKMGKTDLEAHGHGTLGMVKIFTAFIFCHRPSFYHKVSPMVGFTSNKECFEILNGSSMRCMRLKFDL